MKTPDTIRQRSDENSAKTDTNHRIVLYVRAFEPFKHEHETVVERLERLQRAGRIAGFDVLTWPNKVRLSERSICGDVVDVYDRLADWADRNGVSIHPPFDVHETGFALLDERDEVLVLPVMCCSVFDGEDLVGVYPCTVDGTTARIDDCLDALEHERELPP